MGRRRSVWFSDETDKAFREYLEKTGRKPTETIADIVERFLANDAKEVIPQESAKVEAMRLIRDYKAASQLMKMVMSAGFSGWNLGQALEKIENMPMPEKFKDSLRNTAKIYDAFKSNGAKKIVKLMPTAYPTVGLGKKKRTFLHS